MAAGVRKFQPAPGMVKLTFLVPEDTDRELRKFAADQGKRLGPMLREWIEERLTRAGKPTRAAHQGSKAARKPYKGT